MAGLSFLCYFGSWTPFCSYVKLTCFHGVFHAYEYMYFPIFAHIESVA